MSLIVVVVVVVVVSVIHKIMSIIILNVTYCKSCPGAYRNRYRQARNPEPATPEPLDLLG